MTAPYINFNGDPQSPPPYTFRNITLRTFPLAADEEKLQDLCDKFLNFPQANFQYRPLTSLVLFQLVTYPLLASKVPAYRRMGFVEQHEWAVVVPVVRYKRGVVPTAIEFFSAYIFVDNPDSAVAGRTILGFPKVIGSFDLPHEPSKVFPSSVEAMVYPVFAPDQLQVWREVLGVERAADPGPPPV